MDTQETVVKDIFEGNDDSWAESILMILDELDVLLPVVLDRRLPKGLHDQLQNLLLDARDLKAASTEWVH